MSTTGWMTTKKKGRDDKAIAADAQRAMADRRKKRGAPARAKAKNNTRTTTNSTRRKQPPRRQKAAGGVVDSDESEFSEIEEESEEEEEFDEEEEESSEEEVSLQDDDNDDDVSDDNGGSFLPKLQRNNVKVKPMLKETEKLKTRNRKAGFVAATASKPCKGKIVSRSSTSSSSDDDSDMDVDRYVNGSGKVAAVSTKNEPMELGSSSDDDDDDSTFNKSNKRPKTSKYFNKSSTAAKSTKKTALWGDDDEETPKKTETFASKPKSAVKKRGIAIDEDEEDAPIVAASKAVETSFSEDDFMDDDEAIAYARAIKASLKETKMNATSKEKKAKTSKFKKLGGTGVAKHNRKRDNEKALANDNDDLLQDSDDDEVDAKNDNIVYLDESDNAQDSSSDESDPEGEDAFVADDEGAKEAREILATANDLSVDVLRIMTSWASNSGESNDNATVARNEKGELKIPQGMIVDGAIAMSSLKSKPGKNASNGNHSWISEEVMSEALPQLTLKEYQLLGVNWLAMLHRMKCKVSKHNNSKKKVDTSVNGVLADEMGLGKTCQTIAFLAWLRHSRNKGELPEPKCKGNIKCDVSDDEDSDDDDDDGERKPASQPSALRNKRAQVSLEGNVKGTAGARLPHLIVVPATVVSNWKREFTNFAPAMHVVQYYGSMEERGDLQRMLRPYTEKQRDPAKPMVDVILAPITYFEKESSTDRDFLRKFQFEYLIVDEAHLLKNAKGRRYRNLKRLKTQRCLLLTGTPVQNNPSELMALLCFLMPLFSQRAKSYDDEEGGSDGGESMLQHFVNLSKEKEEDAHEYAYKKLKALFAPFVLRRKKSDVLSQILPEKKYELAAVDLDPRAQELYNSIIEQHLKAKRNKKASVTNNLFITLRKAATHPLLLRTRFKSAQENDQMAEVFFNLGAFRGDAASKERIAKELENYNDFEIHLLAHDVSGESITTRKKLAPYFLDPDDLLRSAKFKKLKELLPGLIEKGHRILIFSVWTSSLDLLGWLLDTLNIDYRRMDGQTTVDDRQGCIDEFNHDPTIPVFLLSTRACGLGITLTAADYCIMYDIDLNPFTDLQAEDRCHRIGQTKPVTVIKIITKNTVEEDIYNMQERKKKMNAAIMETPTEWSKQEQKAKAEVMKCALDRFLGSPVPKASASKANSGGSGDAEKENALNIKKAERKEVIDLI